MATNRPTSSPRRRWLSFSLRGMFILMTIACIWLAVVATRARKQQQAVSKIQELGGGLRFDYQRDRKGQHAPDGKPHAPQWLRNAIGEDYFRRVVTVDFAFGGGSKVSDDDLVVFDALPDLTSLELGNNPGITDAGLEHLAGLSKLRALYLYKTNVKGPGIGHLPQGLTALMLNFTPLEDEGLAHIKNMPKLTHLQLGHTAITDQGLANLSESLALESLRLGNTEITDAGLEHLKTLTNLKQLSLVNTNVTGRGVERLQQALPNCWISPDPKWLDATPKDVELWPDGYQPSQVEVMAKIQELGDADVKLDQNAPGQPIVYFRLFESTISDESLIRLLAEMPELEQLNLRHVVVGDRLAKELPRLKKLWFLSLHDSRITDEGLTYVGQVTTLRELSLASTRVSDAGLARLGGLKNLEYVDTDESGVTDNGFINLKQSLPQVTIPLSALRSAEMQKRVKRLAKPPSNKSK